ncbi:MAG: DUF362 domain-containing protein [Candidatus Anammoxibacter sp.]
MSTNKTTISIVKCDNYDRANVNLAVDKTFEYFGGIRDIISSCKKVLIKPNFLKKSLPETCTITHSAIIESVAEKLLEMGIQPIIGDSPAFGAVSKIAKCIGLDKFAQKHNIDIIELDEPRLMDMKCGTKLFSQTVSGRSLDVDAIINLPKLKAHNQIFFTAAVKNMYGCVSGKRKAWRHLKSNNDIGWYTEMLLANYLTVKPVFTIVDAVMTMEKCGPTGGVPRQLSLIVGGSDCVAIDRVIAEIINVSPSQVPILKTADKHNIGEQDLGKITIAGEPISSVKVFDYKLPELMPIGFSGVQITKSVVKHLWMKNFGKST